MKFRSTVFGIVSYTRPFIGGSRVWTRSGKNVFNNIAGHFKDYKPFLRTTNKFEIDLTSYGVAKKINYDRVGVKNMALANP